MMVRSLTLPRTPSRKGRGDFPMQSPLPLREEVRGKGKARANSAAAL